MTSLSTRKKDLALEIPELDVAARLPDPDTKPEDIVEISVLDKKYYFSKEHVKKYPKLLDPDTRFLLQFDNLLGILYSYGASCIDPKVLDEPHEKQIFLMNLEFLEIEINNDLILHLCQGLRKEVQEASDLVARHVGGKGKSKIRIDQDKEVVKFVCSYDAAFRECGADFSPTEIIRYLAAGTPSLLDAIVISDFKSKNLISSFVKSFLEYLSGK